MTKNNPNLVSLLEALAEVLKMIEATRDSSRENESELDPNDPLNEIMEPGQVATDSSTLADTRVRTLLEDSVEPRTLRNLLKTYMRTLDPDDWYTVRSRSTRKYYRIVRVFNRYVTTPDGSSQLWASGHGISLPVSIEDLTAGWRVGNAYKVLEVFELID